MKATTGVFRSMTEARAAIDRLRLLGIEEENINLLTPSSSIDQVEGVPTDEAEQPGMGKAVGAVLGGVAGLAAGPIGASLLSVALPGVGSVVAIGFYAAAILGVGGAVAGAAAGGAVENSLSDGLPKDELFVYEDALRQGRTVVIALAEDEKQADEARDALEDVGAETIDAARKQWWIGLRDAEAEHYRATGSDFAADERIYREGFESALHPDIRGSFEKSRNRLSGTYASAHEREVFLRGFDRGRRYHEERLSEEMATKPR
jgi:hypothetical protein